MFTLGLEGDGQTPSGAATEMGLKNALSSPPERALHASLLASNRNMRSKRISSCEGSFDWVVTRLGVFIPSSLVLIPPLRDVDHLLGVYPVPDAPPYLLENAPVIRRSFVPPLPYHLPAFLLGIESAFRDAPVPVRSLRFWPKRDAF